jgi:hypothetical protein
MRTLLTAAVLAVLALVTVPGVAHAECDAPPSTEAGLESARTVFVGTVASVGSDSRTATFDVQWVWKGQGVQERVSVHGAGDADGPVGPDDRQFQAGVTYLVASPSAAQPYLADRCTSTRAYQAVGSAIPPNYQDAVGASSGWSPDPVPEAAAEGSSLPAGPILPIIFGGLIVVGVGIALSKITRGPDTAASRQATAATVKPRSRRSGRAPSVGRTGERFSGLFRRSGVNQASKLRGIRSKPPSRLKKRPRTGA